MIPPITNAFGGVDPWVVKPNQLLNTSTLIDSYIVPLLEHAFNRVGHCNVSCDRLVVVKNGPGPINTELSTTAGQRRDWGYMYITGQIAMKVFVPVKVYDCMARFIYRLFVHEARHLVDLWRQLEFGPYDIPYEERQHEIRAFEVEHRMMNDISTGADKAGRRLVDLMQAHCWRTLGVER